VQIGLKTFEAGPNSYVVIPAGTVHRAWNAGDVPVKRLTLLLPEPPPGERRDIPVTIDAPTPAKSSQ
jgi:mannose-6-phosphate isomerase-like protein (cupin superfamily)